MRNVTISLTEADARLLIQQIDVWVASEATQANKQLRKNFERIADSLRYQTGGEEQSQGARGL